MAYCVRCGVELAASEKKCPLCGTPVVPPELPETEGIPPYPIQEKRNTEPNRSKGILFILTMLFLLPISVVFLSDLQINDAITWSGFAGLAILLLYVIIVLPFWFQHPNPVIFVPIDFAAIGGYLLYICLATGGNWFLPFAFPLTGSILLVVTAALALIKYVRRGHLYIAAGLFFATGGIAVLTEFLLSRTFPVTKTIFWSTYPLIACFLTGAILIVIAICRPLRESFRKRFFL